MSSEAPTFGAADSTTAMNDAVHDEEFDNLTFTQENDPPTDDGGENPFNDFLNADEPEFEPDLSLIKGKPRPAKAKQYERKVQGVFALGVKLTIANEKTVADSAALLLHGPNIAEKAGDLAAVDARAAAIIDAITDQTENPRTALIVASFPLVLQVIRNHEPSLVKESKGIPIGRGRRIKFRIPFKLGKRMKNMTQDPQALTVKVLTNEKVREALDKQGITIVTGE